MLQGDVWETHVLTNDMEGGWPFSRSILSAGEAQVNQQGNACQGGLPRGGDLQAESLKNRDMAGRQANEAGRTFKAREPVLLDPGPIS